MKTVIQILISLFLIISCDKKVDEIKSDIPQPILIKIGYYPSFHQPCETIFNLNDKYLIFYNPTSYDLLPPPPPREDGTSSPEEQKNYKEFLSKRPELTPFKSNISENEIERILKITDSFKTEDFNNKNIPPALDGMSTNIIILYSDGNLVQINPMNVPNLKQRELYGEILNVLIEKNTDKNDSIILQQIKDYH